MAEGLFLGSKWAGAMPSGSLGGPGVWAVGTGVMEPGKSGTWESDQACVTR